MFLDGAASHRDGGLSGVGGVLLDRAAPGALSIRRDEVSQLVFRHPRGRGEREVALLHQGRLGGFHIVAKDDPNGGGDEEQGGSSGPTALCCASSRWTTAAISSS